MHLPTLSNRRRDPDQTMSEFGATRAERELDRFFDLMRTDPFGLTDRLAERAQTGFGAMDLMELDDAYVAEIDVPGLSKDQMEIEVADGMLTVRGQREETRKEEAKEYRRLERSFGAFSRRIDLPSDVAVDRVTAECENGVLKIQLPKSDDETKRPRKIEVAG